jgi:predicted permease
VLNHAFWTARFASDSTILGKSVVLNGAPFTVVGVAAPRFQGPFVMAPDAWVPIMSLPLTGFGRDIYELRAGSWIVAIGRLAADASVGSAQAEMSGILARLREQYPQANHRRVVSVTPMSVLPGDLRKIIGGFIAVLFVFAGVVLVIASTNVAGMLLARAAQRQREIAVRLAIGASRGQLIRQLATESVTLFVVAGAAGVALAQLLVNGLMALVPKLPVPLVVDPRVDWRVLAFALGASVVTGLAAGLLPALQSTAISLVPALKSDAGATRRQRLRGALLVTQIAFSMLLLIVAGLFGRTLAHARGIDAGFDVADVHLARMDFELAQYDAPRGTRLAQTMLDGARGLPQVRSAALSRMLPLSGSRMGMGSVTVPGRRASAESEGWDAGWNVVTPGFFTTLGVPIVRGRDFTAADRQGATEVAILNETFARALFGERDPLGQVVHNGDRVLTVVGVARDVKYRSLGERPSEFIYVPLAQRYTGRMTLLVRTEPGAQPVSAMRRMVADIDRNLPILDVGSLQDAVAPSLFPQRVAMWVAGTLGVVALLLALLGIYGVVSFSVAQRTREIGVRVALGADRWRVVGMVLRQGMVLAGLGVGIGALAAFGATRLIANLLYGVPPTDTLAFSAAAALLALAALTASWLPARRAAAVDPVVALRSD